jgi:hypothetical protein
MRYYLDTEFSEIGPLYPIELISIGIVAEDGREYYSEAVFSTSRVNEWVKQNVIPHLSGQPGKSLGTIAAEIKAFIPPKVGDDPAYMIPEFWGYFADYDWVVFCQIFGTMMDLPKGYPMLCYDLKQLAMHQGVPRRAFPQQEGQEHNALEDARWNKKVYDFLEWDRRCGARSADE